VERYDMETWESLGELESDSSGPETNPDDVESSCLMVDEWEAMGDQQKYAHLELVEPLRLEWARYFPGDPISTDRLLSILFYGTDVEGAHIVECPADECLDTLDFINRNSGN